MYTYIYDQTSQHNLMFQNVRSRSYQSVSFSFLKQCKKSKPELEVAAQTLGEQTAGVTFLLRSPVPVTKYVHG